MSEDKKPSIFDELNKQIKAANGEVPNTFVVGGETFIRRGSKPKPKRGNYTNPRTGKTEEDVLLESITIDLAPYADRITLDGVIYLANTTRDVPVAVATTLRDIMARTWQHEYQTGGANSFGAGVVRNPSHVQPGVGYAR